MQIPRPRKCQVLRIDSKGIGTVVSEHQTENAARKWAETAASADSITENRPVTYLVCNEMGKELDSKTSTPN